MSLKGADDTMDLQLYAKWSASLHTLALSIVLNEAMTAERGANDTVGAGRIVDAPMEEELLISFKERFNLIERPPQTRTSNIFYHTDPSPQMVSIDITRPMLHRLPYYLYLYWYYSKDSIPNH